MRRRNRINGQFSARLIEMLESPAYRTLSHSGHRVLARLEIELAHHGGNDNGALPVTYKDFLDYGITRECIAPAIREVQALGFAEITKRGRGGNAEFREPTKFRLTYTHDRSSRYMSPSHEWRRIKTFEEAEALAKRARLNRDPIAVAKGNRNRYGKSGLNPVRKSHIETTNLPIRKIPITGSVGKPVLLSISRGGEPNSQAGDLTSKKTG